MSELMQIDGGEPVRVFESEGQARDETWALSHDNLSNLWSSLDDVKALMRMYYDGHSLDWKLTTDGRAFRAISEQLNKSIDHLNFLLEANA